LALEVQNWGGGLPGKLATDIHLVLVPHGPQMVQKCYELGFLIFAPNSPGGAPKRALYLLPVSTDFALSSSAPFGLPPLGLPPIGLSPLDSNRAKFEGSLGGRTYWNLLLTAGQ